MHNNPTTTFKAGTRYFCRSICDYECIWTYEVVKRTACTVLLKGDNGEVSRKRVRVWEGVEACDPKGRYSMSPVLTADKVSP